MSGAWQQKRFWSEVVIIPSTGGFSIALDDKRINTPSKTPVIVPTRALAELIADEWRAQGEVVLPATMPHTCAANAAIDKVAKTRVTVVVEIADYGQSDLLCYREVQERALADEQNEAWAPVLEWAANNLDLRLRVGKGLMPIEQDPKTGIKCRELVAANEDFALTALYNLVSLTGSLILGLAAAKAAWPPDEIWQKSRVDEEFQARNWGRDDEASEVASQKRQAFFNALAFYQAASGGF